MSLDVDGQPILSQGEFVELVRSLKPDHTGSGTLQAWWAGERVDASTLYLALDVEARLASQTDRAHELIDAALDRLETAFPGRFGADE